MNKCSNDLLGIERAALALAIHKVCSEKLNTSDSVSDVLKNNCQCFVLHKGPSFADQGNEALFLLHFHKYSHPSHLIAYVINLFEPECDLVPQVSVSPFISLLSTIEKCYDRCLVCSLERGICACLKLDVLNPGYYRYMREMNELVNISVIVGAHNYIDLDLLESQVIPAFRAPFVTTMPKIIRPAFSKLARILFLAIEALHFQKWYFCKHSEIIMSVIRDGNDLVCFLTNYHNNPHIYVYYHCWNGKSSDFTFPTYPLSYYYPLHHPLSVCVTKIRNPFYFESNFCSDLSREAPKWLGSFCKSLALPDPHTCKSCCSERTRSCGRAVSSSSSLVTLDWKIDCPNL